MSKISRTRGKNFELAIAKIFGAKRNHFESEDILHPKYSIECKHRKKLSAQIKKWAAQNEAAAEESKIPFVVMHEESQKYLDSFVIIRLRNFLKATNAK